ncbi:MAG: nuclear transport factor 2 family protein [Gemmatimonadaceae bacterium]|nr:nuclear transport factor 2 family protein [Gemmatimonadaceae bacterium]
MTTQTKEQELIETEQAFWDAMKSKDGNAAQELTDDGSIIVGAQGVSAIDRKSMARMTAEGKWELKEFSFNEKTRQVRFLTDDIAIVAYSVNERIVVEGKELQFDAHDSSVWIRRDGEWRCALHTESPAGDPFGRDKAPKK